MHVLSHLKLRTKLALLLGLSVLTAVALIGVSASLLHQRMVADRADKLQAVVQSAMGIAQALESQIAAGKLIRGQALAQLRNDVHAMRFRAGDGYLSIQSYDGVTLIHGIDPGRESKPGTARDSAGKPVIELINDTLRNGNEGFVTYLFPKPGKTQPQPKVGCALPAVAGDLPVRRIHG